MERNDSPSYSNGANPLGHPNLQFDQQENESVISVISVTKAALLKLKGNNPSQRRHEFNFLFHPESSGL